MRKICLLSIAFILSNQVFASPTFWLDWSTKANSVPEVTAVKGVTYLGGDNDPNCSADVFVDQIKSFNYSKDTGDLLVNTLKEHSVEPLAISSSDLKKLSPSQSSYLMKLLTTKEKVIFIGERCGNSGKYFNVGSILKLNSIK